MVSLLAFRIARSNKINFESPPTPIADFVLGASKSQPIAATSVSFGAGSVGQTRSICWRLVAPAGQADRTALAGGIEPRAARPAAVVARTSDASKYPP